MKRRLGLMLIVIMAAVTWAAPAFAAPVHLPSIKAELPARVAVDIQGNVYVTTDEGVLRCSPSGACSTPITNRQRFGSIAVDQAGRIYAGLPAKQAILVYNPDFSFSHYFGAIPNQFGSISDIAIDGTGRVYVVDNARNMVSVYEATGKLAFSFGGYGAENGKFIYPIAIAVNDAVDEVYVTDLLPMDDGSSGARISVFDKNGNIKRAIGKAGLLAGDISRPVGIAVDPKTGLLYVSDTYQNAALTVDPATGAVVGAVYDLTPGRQMLTPQGVAFGKNRIVYVASSGTDSLELYGLDGYVSMDTAPAYLQFAAAQLGASPAPQAITIANAGAGPVDWTVSKDHPWILINGQSVLEPAIAGTAGPAGASALEAGVSIAGLAPGVYQGNIIISTELGLVRTIPVSLTITPAPEVALSSGLLIFTAKQNSSAPAQPVTVSVANAEALHWTMERDPAATWLSITPSSGDTTTTSEVSISTAGLASGAYTGYLTVNAPGALGTGNRVKVNLTVESSTKISVTTNVDGASFTITGPNSEIYSSSARNWSVEDVAAGAYSIAYAPVQGYQAPKTQTLNIAGSPGEIAFHGEYLSDAIAPVLTLSTLADGSYTNNDMLNIAGTATDNLTLASVTVNDVEAAVNADGSFSQALRLVLGANLVTTIAKDAAGNTAAESRTVVLDQTAPVITIAGLSDNSVAKAPDQTVAGLVEETATVSVQVNGAAPIAADMTGNSFSLPVVLAYGQNTVLVTATDLAGNFGTIKRTVTLDNVNPTVAITSPAQDITTNKTGLTFTGTVDDLTGVSVTVTIDGAIYAPEVANGAFQQDLQFSEEKIYSVYVTATDQVGNATTVQRNIEYVRTPTVLSYTGPAVAAQGGRLTVSGTLMPVNAGEQDLSGLPVVFTIGGQFCTGTTNAQGDAGCAIDKLVSPALGPVEVTAAFAGNSAYKPANGGGQAIVFSFSARGVFVIGDNNAVPGNTVTFWGAQWSKANSLSSGAAPASFKGFAGTSGGVYPVCGIDWTTGSGNSTAPPASVPSYLAVLVTDGVTKSGNDVSGKITKIIVVKTDPGYGPDPALTGMGTVVGVFGQN